MLVGWLLSLLLLVSHSPLGVLSAAPTVSSVTPSRLSTVSASPLTLHGGGFVNAPGLAVRISWGAHPTGGTTGPAPPDVYLSTGAITYSGSPAGLGTGIVLNATSATALEVIFGGTSGDDLDVLPVSLPRNATLAASNDGVGGPYSTGSAASVLVVRSAGLATVTPSLAPSKPSGSSPQVVTLSGFVNGQASASDEWRVLFEPSGGGGASFEVAASVQSSSNDGSVTLTCEAPDVSPLSGLFQARVSRDGGASYGVQAARMRYFAVSAVSPVVARASGGSTITVIGTSFAASGPRCRFGTTAAVNAVYLTPTSVTCATPAGTAGSSAAVEVAIGPAGTSSFSSNGITLAYVDPPGVTLVTPAVMPREGGGLVTLTGSAMVANPISATTGPVCRFSAGSSHSVDVAGTLNVGSASITCAAPPRSCPGSDTVSVSASLDGGVSFGTAGGTLGYFDLAFPVTPEYAEPGSTVTVRGAGFAGAAAAAASSSLSPIVTHPSFGTVAGTYSSTSPTPPPYITFVVPANATRGATGKLRVSVDGGTHLSAADVSPPLTIARPLTVGAPDPTYGRAEGSTTVSFLLHGLCGALAPPNPTDTVAPACANATVLADPKATPPAGVTLSPVCTFAAITVAAEWVQATAGDALPGGGTWPVRVRCRTPPGFSATAMTFAVGPGARGIALATYSYFGLTGLTPVNGPRRGGTRVRVTGFGLSTNPADLRCTFSGVAASIDHAASRSDLIVCVTPALPRPAGVPKPDGNAPSAVEVAVSSNAGLEFTTQTFLYYDDPAVTAVVPRSGPTQGGTRVTVTGTDFPKGLLPRCTFGDEEARAVERDEQADPNTVVCVSPAGNKPARVRLAFNGDDVAEGPEFSFYGFSGFSPIAGPLTGGTSVTVRGFGFLVAEGPKCLFNGRAVNATVVSDTTLTCVAPVLGSARLARFLGRPGALPDFDPFAFRGDAADDHPTAITPEIASAMEPTVPTREDMGPSASVSASSVSVSGGSGPGSRSGSHHQGSAPSASKKRRHHHITPSSKISPTTRQTANDTTGGGTAGSAGEAITLTVSLNGLRDVTPASPAAPGTPGTAFVPYQPPILARVDPRVGPSIGGTRVTITGAFFTGQAAGQPAATPGLTAELSTACVFGDIPSPEPATFVSSSRILCVTPPSPADRVTVRLTGNGIDLSAPTSAGDFSYAGCAPGSYSPGFPTPCTLCPPGSFSAATASTNCTLCGAEQYQPAAGATTCVPCPAKSSAFPGADRAEACECAQNHYRPAGAAATSACIACPQGGTCTGDSIVAQPGYYQDPSNPEGFLRCEPASVCDGASCRVGHTGFLCRSCMPDYYHQGLLCERCPGQSSLLMVAAVAVGIIAVIALLVLAGPTMTTYSATLLIFAAHSQTVSTSMNIELNWPQGLKDARLGFTSVYTLDFSVPECSMGMSWSLKWLLSLASPFIFALALGIAWLFVYAHSAMLRRNKPPGWTGPPPEVRAKSLWARIARTPANISEYNRRTLNASILFLLAAYLPLSREALSFFACSRLGDDHVLDVNGEHICYSSWWYTRLPAAAAAVLLYVIGIPCACVVVYRKRKLAQGAQTFTNSVGAIYRRFDRTLPYWEMVVCLRKLGVVVGSLFFATCPLCQVGLLVLVLINAGLLHAYKRPYGSPRHNALESVGLGVQVLVLLAGISYSEGDINDSGRDAISTVTGALIAIGALALPFVWLYDNRRPYVPRKRARRAGDGASAGGDMSGPGGSGRSGGGGLGGGGGKKNRTFSAAIGITDGAGRPTDADADDDFDTVKLTDAAFGASLSAPADDDMGRPSTGDYTEVKVAASKKSAGKKQGKKQDKKSGGKKGKKGASSSAGGGAAGGAAADDIDYNLDDMFGDGAEDAAGGIVGSEMGGPSFL